MSFQVQRPSFTGPPPWRLSSDNQTNNMPKNESSALSPYTVTAIYYRDEPRWLDSTWYHIMPNPRDMVTIMGKAELHPESGNYTAAEIASCARLSNFDSTAKPPDTNRGVRATLRHENPARPGSDQAPVVPPPYDMQLPLSIFLYRLTFAQNRTGNMESARTHREGIHKYSPRRQYGYPTNPHTASSRPVATSSASIRPFIALTILIRIDVSLHYNT